MVKIFLRFKPTPNNPIKNKILIKISRLKAFLSRLQRSQHAKKSSTELVLIKKTFILFLES